MEKTVHSKTSRCPVEVTLSFLSSRWTVLILRELLYGTKRFGQIRSALGGVSTKVLTANLRSMEEHGLLTRQTFAEVPPRVEYTLTELGESLRPILMAMAEWGSSYKMLTEGAIPLRCQNGEVILVVKKQAGVFIVLSDHDEKIGAITFLDAEHHAELNPNYENQIREEDLLNACNMLDSQAYLLHS